MASAAVNAPEGHYRSELIVERGSQKRVLASNRVVARNEKNQPEFLIALFDDVTDLIDILNGVSRRFPTIEALMESIPDFDREHFEAAFERNPELKKDLIR